MSNSLLGFACVALLILAIWGSMVAVVVVQLLVKARKTPRPQVPESHEEPWRRASRSPVPPTVLQQCPQCGGAVAADGVEGMCPQCLLKGAISSAHDAAQSGNGEHTAAYQGAAAPAVVELAALLPQLEILELIGQGGMGAVYKARQPSLDRLVAVKVLPPEAGRDPAFAERFSREARALARLSHPNIVGVHESGHTGDQYYIVMEYVDGVNLRQLLRSGHIKPEQALRIIPQICDALQYAHEEGIVHRDVKPENILLDKKGRVKIADFGLAKLLGRDAENFTLTGSRQVMGTLNYMAPEQMERPLEVDHRADIYSLGVVFYEMLTGQLPLGRFPLPSEKAGTDARLDGIVLHAMEREPERRYQHANDVKTDVETDTRGVYSARQGSSNDAASMRIRTARARLQRPGVGLLGTGIANIVLATLLGCAVVYCTLTWGIANHSAEAITLLVAMLAWLMQGSVLILGALKMRQLEWHGWAIASSILALVPGSPGAVLGIPVGIWALEVLTAPDVKAAFAEQARRSQ